jgi:hypothetical protein
VDRAQTPSGGRGDFGSTRGARVRIGDGGGDHGRVGIGQIFTRSWQTHHSSPNQGKKGRRENEKSNSSNYVTDNLVTAIMARVGRRPPAVPVVV